MHVQAPATVDKDPSDTRTPSSKPTRTWLSYRPSTLALVCTGAALLAVSTIIPQECYDLASKATSWVGDQLPSGLNSDLSSAGAMASKAWKTALLVSKGAIPCGVIGWALGYDRGKRVATKDMTETVLGIDSSRQSRPRDSWLNVVGGSRIGSAVPMTAVGGKQRSVLFSSPAHQSCGRVLFAGSPSSGDTSKNADKTEGDKDEVEVEAVEVVKSSDDAGGSGMSPAMFQGRDGTGEVGPDLAMSGLTYKKEADTGWEPLGSDRAEMMLSGLLGAISGFGMIPDPVADTPKFAAGSDEGRDDESLGRSH